MKHTPPEEQRFKAQYGSPLDQGLVRILSLALDTENDIESLAGDLEDMEVKKYYHPEGGKGCVTIAADEHKKLVANKRRCINFLNKARAELKRFLQSYPLFDSRTQLAAEIFGHLSDGDSWDAYTVADHLRYEQQYRECTREELLSVAMKTIEDMRQSGLVRPE